jgi:MFS transporter, AAHS family, 3-hydroxyphenylpropionic acid transporter
MIPPRGARARSTLILCAAAALIEGFDNQSMGVAAPQLFREFSVAASEAGVIFSAATLGLFIGAAIGGRAADHLGRGRTLWVSLMVFGSASLLTSLAHGTLMLIVTRLLTGLGCGGAMPNFIALATAAVDPRRRLSAVTLVMAALPFGGALAGVIALGARLGWNWRSIFIVGGLAPILAAIFVRRIIVEEHRDHRGGTPADAAHAPVRVDTVGSVLWQTGRARTTVLLWIGFFFTQLMLFLMLNWLPSLIVGLGYSRTDASLASIGFNLAGSVGAVFLGHRHAGARRRMWVLITYGGILLSTTALAAVSAFGTLFAVAALACALAGGFIVGAQLVLFALAPLYYPGVNRGTGVGAAVAIGRLGSIAGPVLAGALLVAGGGSASVLIGILPFALIAGSAAVGLTRRPLSAD